MRCSTKHGNYQCEREAGHAGECEAQAAPYDYDAQRELRRAAKRIVAIEKALREIATAPCDAPGVTVVTACTCCMHDRMIARATLDGVE